MASWMVHLRIGDKLLDRIADLSPVDFLVGNLAPDSGVPNDDWTVFTPSTAVSHFKNEASPYTNKVYLPDFVAKYFTPQLQGQYSKEAYSFFLGYLTHLMTDCLWVERIVDPCRLKFAGEYAAEGKAFVARMKEDWYDLDFKYLRDRPGFRAFRVYLGAVGYVNGYMEEFAPDAFDNRRQYITSFYLEENPHIDREYPYLTERQMDAFLNQAAEDILSMLAEYTSLPSIPSGESV